MNSSPSLGSKFLLPPSEEAFAKALGQLGVVELLTTTGLTRSDYSTLRYLSEDRAASWQTVAAFLSPNGPSFVCELPSPLLEDYCNAHELTLANKKDILVALPTVEAAMRDVVDLHPFLATCVHEFVWNCHLVLPPEDSYDVSFSDPNVPFSIFISAPKQSSRTSVLRVAENIVHEAMHLQLTLFETVHPLIDSTSDWSMYSPWKKQSRPAQGILHGLYVFAILRWLWSQTLMQSTNPEDREFAQRRILEIEEEIDAVRDFQDSPALTSKGKTFLAHLVHFAGRPER